MNVMWKWRWMFWLLVAPSPTVIILKEGIRIPILEPPGLAYPMLILNTNAAGKMSVRVTRIDWWRTLMPKAKVVQRQPKPKPDRGRIPWEHPAFVGKQLTTQDIVITGTMVERFGRARNPKKGKQNTGGSASVRKGKKDSPW